MVDMALAYTPHPDSQERRMAPAVVGATGRAASSGGVAVMAAASLAILSSAALLGAPGGLPGITAPAEAAAPAPFSGQSRAFAARETAAEAKAAPSAPVLLAGEPIALENRAASPAPIIGDALGATPPPPAPMPAREQHTLTSFDGTRTMTDGPAVEGAPAPAPYERVEYRVAERSFPPPTPVWNNPIKWISVHKEGL